MFVSSQSDEPPLFENTDWERPYKYDLVHKRAVLENPSALSLFNSFVGEMVSKALLKSNNKRRLPSSCQWPCVCHRLI